MPSDPPTVLVVGDGPTGLSCGLLLAKNGVDCHIIGRDETPTHKAMFHNYLGAPDTPGPEFMITARKQVAAVGAQFHDGMVDRIEKDEGRFRVHTDAGKTLVGDRLVLANGPDTKLAESIGVETRGNVVAVNLDGQTNMENVYAGGWLVRGNKIQAAISVGDGAAIALDILSRVKGKAFHDFDVYKAPEGRKEEQTTRSR